MLTTISLLILGLIVGLIAKLLFPGLTPKGWLSTLLLGISGSYVGGLIGSFVFGMSFKQFSVPNIFLATLGAFVVLWLYNKIKK